MLAELPTFQGEQQLRESEGQYSLVASKGVNLTNNKVQHAGDFAPMQSAAQFVRPARTRPLEIIQ